MPVLLAISPRTCDGRDTPHARRRSKSAGYDERTLLLLLLLAA